MLRISVPITIVTHPILNPDITRRLKDRKLFYELDLEVSYKGLHLSETCYFL